MCIEWERFLHTIVRVGHTKEILVDGKFLNEHGLEKLYIFNENKTVMRFTVYGILREISHLGWCLVGS